MEIWLSMDNDKLRLPVLPSKIEAGSTSNNKTIDINSIGEIMLLGNEDLRTMTIDSFFPNQDYPFVEYSNYLEPWDFVSKILKWKATKKPIRVLITGTILNTEMGIENFKYGEEDGSGDVYYSLSLKDYRRIRVRTLSKKDNEKKQEAKRPVPPKPKAEKTYVVKRGDNLWNISKRFYGNGNQWRKIYNANKKVIGSNPNLIYPKQRFVIP